MRFFIVILLITLVTKLFSQNDFKDTTWFDMNWKESIKSKASYFRVYKQANNGFVVYDKYLDGRTQMMSEAIQIKPTLVKNGKEIYYYENGKVSSYGQSTNGKRSGRWVSFPSSCKDSSIFEHLDNGKLNYTRVCNCNSGNNVLTLVEQMPEFVGGTSAMIDFIRANLIYPTSCRIKGIGGRAFLKFVVDSTGKVNNVQVLKGTGFDELDNEALRVISSMPNWSPGKQDNKPVSVYYNLPLNFKLDYSTPYFYFNTMNKNPNYVKSLELLKAENPSVPQIIDLMKESLVSLDTDELYILGVAYFNNNQKKEACDCFKLVAERTEKDSIIGTNSKGFLQNVCNKTNR